MMDWSHQEILNLRRHLFARSTVFSWSSSSPNILIREWFAKSLNEYYEDQIKFGWYQVGDSIPKSQIPNIYIIIIEENILEYEDWLRLYPVFILIG